MPRPNVFPVDTILYHPVEGPKLFPAGETDPGSMWKDSAAGDPVGEKSVGAALKDLIAAQDQIDGLAQQLVARDHDLAQAARALEEATAKVDGLEQDKIAAEKARDEAMATASDVTGQRDQLAAVETDLRAKLETAEADRDAARLRVTELETDVANATTRAETAEAALAAFDKDGDGKAGGSKSKKPAADTGADSQSGA